jgi:hypothetical protein
VAIAEGYIPGSSNGPPQMESHETICFLVPARRTLHLWLNHLSEPEPRSDRPKRSRPRRPSSNRRIFATSSGSPLAWRFIAAGCKEDLDTGFEELHLHNVNRRQRPFIDDFGKGVLPELLRGATRQ